jgi:hypothetical protein
VQTVKTNIANPRRRFALLLLLTLCSAYTVLSQSNPFDLTPRLNTPQGVDTSITEGTGNPFDVVAPPPGQASSPSASRSVEPAFELKREPVVTVDSQYKRLALIATLISLLLLTILVTLFRGQLSRAYRAFMSDNMLNQLQREYEGGGGFPYYLYYVLFLFNAGFYVYLLAHHNSVSIAATPFWSLLYSIGFVAAFFLSKHLLLTFVGSVFPVRKEIASYNLTIVVFNIVLGLILIIANLLLAYASESLFEVLTYGTLGAVGAVYLFMALRGLFIAGRLIAFHKFHFLLYICTVEIAPIAVIAKLIIS